MRLLYTTPFVPYPPTDGGRLVAYHHVSGLAAHNEITMILPLRRENDRESAARLERFGRVYAAAVRERSRARIAMEALFHGESLRIRRHSLDEIASPVEAALEEPFDLVFLDSLFTSYLLPAVRKRRPNVPVVLFEHNVESQVFRRLVRTRPTPAWRALALWETPRIERAERLAAEGVSRALVLSSEDRRTLKALAPDARIDVCGPGVATFPELEIPPPTNERTVLFLGSYRWPPNVDAAEWLTRAVWPRVRDRVPDAKLVLAGPDPSGAVTRLASATEDVHAPGFVPSAVEATRAAAVSVAPLRIGGGVRLKILEALANERPLVATSIGAEGLDLEEGIHFAKADDDVSFASSIVRLLTDRNEATRLAESGRRRVEERYSWTAAVAHLQTVLEETAAEHVRGARP